MIETMPPETDSRSFSLRGNSIAASPFWLLTVASAAVALWTLLWIVANAETDNSAAWVTLAVLAAIAALNSLAAMGCRVRIARGRLTDLVAWIPVHRCARTEILSVHIRKGPWRVYVVEMNDHTEWVMLGIGPTQFPGNRLPEARIRDNQTIAVMTKPPTTRHSRGATA